MNNTQKHKLLPLKLIFQILNFNPKTLCIAKVSVNAVIERYKWSMRRLLRWNVAATYAAVAAAISADNAT